MSEYVHLKGKLKLVPFIGITLEYTCEWVLKHNGITPDPEYGGDPNPFEMQVMDELYQEYVVLNNNVYQVVESETIDELDIFQADMNNDGTINFEVCYYNGGCSFDEAVNKAVDDMVLNELRKM